MANARRDDNSITTLLGVSSSDSSTPVDIHADPTTHRLLVNSTITGTVTTSNFAITGIADNRKVVASAGTREALAASTACKKVIITAETDNTGVIAVGGTTVVAALATRRGTPLLAGDSIELEIDDLNDINIDSTVTGDGVTYTYFT
jgi:hypothetical protein